MEYTEKKRHIDDIRAGDTVYHDGTLRTVCKNDIKKGGFMGTLLFGDSYRLGSVLVRLLEFKAFKSPTVKA